MYNYLLLKKLKAFYKNQAYLKENRVFD